MTSLYKLIIFTVFLSLPIKHIHTMGKSCAEWMQKPHLERVVIFSKNYGDPGAYQKAVDDAIATLQKRLAYGGPSGWSETTAYVIALAIADGSSRDHRVDSFHGIRHQGPLALSTYFSAALRGLSVRGISVTRNHREGTTGIQPFAGSVESVSVDREVNLANGTTPPLVIGIRPDRETYSGNLPKEVEISIYSEIEVRY